MPIVPPFTVSVVEVPLQIVVVPVIPVGATEAVQAGLNASKIPPFLSEADSVAVPIPVAPMVGFRAQDAPADDRSPLPCLVSKSSESIPGFVVFQALHDGLLPADCPNITMAVFAVTVVTLVATTPVWLD